MRKLLLFVFVSLMACSSGIALDRQPNADYHARREALAKKAGGVVVLVAPLEGSDAVYAFRQDDNFYYLSGITTPGAALLVANATEAQGDNPARAYSEILFLPPRNLRLEKFTGPQLGADSPDATKVTGFDRVAEMSKLPEEVGKLLAGGRPVVYTDVSSQGEATYNTEALDFLKRSNTAVFFQDVKPMLSSLRTAKDAGEIALIQKAVLSGSPLRCHEGGEAERHRVRDFRTYAV
jgi:Xaa-Pro aminopeptidase